MISSLASHILFPGWTNEGVVSPYKTQNYFVKQTSAHPIRFHYSIFSRYDIIIFPSPRFLVDGVGVGGVCIDYKHDLLSIL